MSEATMQFYFGGAFTDYLFFCGKIANAQFYYEVLLLFEFKFKGQFNFILNYKYMAQ